MVAPVTVGAPGHSGPGSPALPKATGNPTVALSELQANWAPDPAPSNSRPKANPSLDQGVPTCRLHSNAPWSVLWIRIQWASPQAEKGRSPPARHLADAMACWSPVAGHRRLW